MDTYISLGNAKSDLRAIADPAKKAFVQHLVKLFNPKLSEHSKMLRESSGDLAKLDRHSTQIQFFLTQTISRFHYVQKSAINFDKDIYSKKVVQDSFDALAKYVQFNFAFKIGEEISQKIMQFFKLTQPAVQESHQKHLVLGTAGTLLKVSYKIVYVQLDESTKWKYWTSFSKQPLKKKNQKNQIHFVAILFSISIVNNHLSKEEDVIISTSRFKFTKKHLNFIETKQKLMSFVDVKRSDYLFLAFDKFQLLHFGKFKEYCNKYLTQQAIKIGYFDSMRQYYRGSNSIFASGARRQLTLSSNPLEIYKHIVLPAINILTPIKEPMLPGFLNQVLSQKMLLGLPSGFEQVAILENQLLNQGHNEPDQKERIAMEIEHKIEILQKNFHMQVSTKEKDAGYQLQGVMLGQLIKSVHNRVGQVQVNRKQGNSGYRNEYYTGILYDEQTVISFFSMQNVSKARFVLEQTVFFIDLQHIQTTGRILKISKEKVQMKASEYSFSLNFMQDYASQFCLHEQLVNKSIFMAGIRSESIGNTTRNVKLQVSKPVSLFRKEFFQLFQKQPGFEGAPIFFVDETKKQCKIIAVCQNTNNFASLFRRREQEDIKNPAIQQRSLLDFSTRFLKKETYAQVVKEKPKAEKIDFQIVDTNEKGEPLRDQLLSKSIQGSSPIELIGIFKMVSHGRTRYGIALFCKNNYFIASASSVLFDGSGYIHLIRGYAEDQQKIQVFQGLDLEECCQYAQLEIQSIRTIPDNQEYVYIEVKEGELKKLKTERGMNMNSLECLLDSRETGGFFLEFDFKNASQTNFISFNYYQITKNFSLVLAQTEKQYPDKQGVMLAYSKNNPKIQYFLGLYSPKSPLGSFPLPEIGQSQSQVAEQRLVITVGQNGQVIRLQKMEEVVEKQLYEAIGYFKLRSFPFEFGTGVLISTDNNRSHQKVKKILTCAHNFYSISDGKIIDDRKRLRDITFCYYKRSLFQFCELSLQKVIIHPTYKEIIDRSINQTPSEQLTSLQLSSAYDIAIVLLEERVCLERPFYLELPFEKSESLPTLLQTFKKNKILTKSFISQIEVAGFPENQISLGIVQGKMYKENVQSHKGEDFSKKYPLFYFNVVPVSSSTQQPLIIDHRLSTLPGQSGSPIFNKETRIVVGVHVGSLRDKGIQNKQQTYSNLGSFVYSPSVYQFLKENN